MELIIGGGALLVSLTCLTIVLKQNGNFQKSADDKYTHKDVCKVIHSQISDDLKVIKQDVKEILRQNGNN